MYNNKETTNLTIDNSEEKLLKCCFIDCDQKFLEKVEFLRHLAKHTNEKTFKCDFCPKMYLCPLTLRIHIEKSHSESSDKVEETSPSDKTFSERIFKCNYENCKQTFKGFKCLQNHMKKHLGMRMKTYLCHICNSRFISQMNLRSHLESHGERLLNCPARACTMKFKSNDLLQKHYNIVHQLESARISPSHDYNYNNFHTTNQLIPSNQVVQNQTYLRPNLNYYEYLINCQTQRLLPNLLFQNNVNYLNLNNGNL